MPVIKTRFSISDGSAWNNIIQDAHNWFDDLRRKKNLKPWDWINRKESDMNSEICKPCADAGFKNIIAAYKGVKAGMSHNGKEIPPMCYDHKNGRVPKYIQRELDKKSVDNFLSLKATKDKDSDHSADNAKRIHDIVEKPPSKWGGTLHKILDIKKNVPTEIELPPDGTRNQLSIMLYQSKLTDKYRFKTESLTGHKVLVTLLGIRESAYSKADALETTSSNPIRTDENDYTEITNEQKLLMLKLHEEGYNNTQIGDKLGIKPWRVQRITSRKDAFVRHLDETSADKEENEDIVDDQGPSEDTIAQVQDAMVVSKPVFNLSLMQDGVKVDLRAALELMHKQLEEHAADIRGKIEAVETVLKMIEKEGA